jgi:hypothetical protein
MSKVYFEIQSERKGSVKFNELGLNEIPCFCEDEPLAFIIKAPYSYGNLTISLQDFQIDCKEQVSDDFEKRLFKSEKDKHFSYLFGQSEIFLTFSNTEESFSVVVEVLATKFTVEQAKRLLDYLSNKMSNILQICFSKSKRSVGFSDGENRDVSIMLEHAEKGLKLFSRHKNQFKQKKITILKPKIELQNRKQVNQVTNNTVAWIFNNLDKAYTVDSNNLGFFHINGRGYEIDAIESENLFENSDVYENQLIFSYLHDIKKFLQNVRSSFNSQNEIKNDESDYFRFEEVLGDVKNTLFLKPRIDKCTDLIDECNQLIGFMKRHIPCSLEKNVRVKITPSVRVNQHYKQMFLYIYEWQNFGEPNWKAEEYLYGLRTLWKLYEFFCLYELIDGLEKAGFELENSEKREFSRKHGFGGIINNDNKNNPNNFYLFKRGNIMISFYYEPNIWSYTQEYTKEYDLVDIYHSGKAHRSRFSPDFLMKVNIKEHEFLMIFDSKYSTRETVKKYSLPSLMERYLHGIQKIQDGKMTQESYIKFLYALHPVLSHENVVIHESFYAENFGLFSQKPVIPALGSISVSPNKDSNLKDVFEAFFALQERI